MEEPRVERIPIETVIKRSWPLLAFGAVLFVAVIAGLLWYAISGKGRHTDLSVAQATSTEVAIATSTGDAVPRALDGMWVTPAEAQLQPFAVMVENHPDARPLSGPARANLVYEIPVEGGITRYMLVFDATTTVDQIGPVRSARPYFVDLADGLNAVYAHVGGSQQALDQIKSMSSFRNLDEFANGKYFWRSFKRVAPHNAYTRTDLMQSAFAVKKWETGRFRGWRYKDDDAAASTTTTVRGTEDGPKVAYGGSFTTSWAYDQATNMYTRFEAGVVQKDLDGAIVRAKNVVVMVTDGWVIDSYGRLTVRTTGRGKATLYRDGKKSELMWTRSAGSNLRFEGLDGTDAMFNRGTTWVEVTFGNGASSTQP